MRSSREESGDGRQRNSACMQQTKLAQTEPPMLHTCREFLDKTVEKLESFWLQHGIRDPFKE